MLTTSADRAVNNFGVQLDTPSATVNDKAADDPVAPDGAISELRAVTGFTGLLTRRSNSVGADIALATAGNAPSSGVLFGRMQTYFKHFFGMLCTLNPDGRLFSTATTCTNFSIRPFIYRHGVFNHRRYP